MRLLAIDTSADLSVGVAVDGRPPVWSHDGSRANARRAADADGRGGDGRGQSHLPTCRGSPSPSGPAPSASASASPRHRRWRSPPAPRRSASEPSPSTRRRRAAKRVRPAPVVVALAAGRGEIYAQRFAADGSADSEPQLAPPETFRALIDATAILAGSAAETLATATGVGNPIVRRDASPDIAALLALARRVPDQGTAPRPLYLRPPDAKPQPVAQVRRQ